jgi:hypothetical protein
MTKVNISEAAKLADISRSKFYENYINTGKISVDKSNPKKPMVDTSELLRVFGELHASDTSENNNRDTREQHKKTHWDTENDTIQAKLFEMERRLLMMEGENKLLASEKQSMERLLDERENTIADLRQQTQKQLAILERSQLMLEDKKKPSLLQRFFG